MKKLHKIFTAVCLAVISILFLMTYTIIAKELPVLLEVSQLDESYNGKRIAVMGWARSAEALRGRRGSAYVRTELGEEGQSVTIFSDFSPYPYNVVNHRVIVQGVYHHRGWYAGYLADHFIVADALMED